MDAPLGPRKLNYNTEDRRATSARYHQTVGTNLLAEMTPGFRLEQRRHPPPLVTALQCRRPSLKNLALAPERSSGISFPHDLPQPGGV